MSRCVIQTERRGSLVGSGARTRTRPLGVVTAKTRRPQVDQQRP